MRERETERERQRERHRERERQRERESGRKSKIVKCESFLWMSSLKFIV